MSRAVHTVCLVALFCSLLPSSVNASVDMSSTNYWETYVNGPETTDQRNALKWESYKWPNGTVPYLFDQSYTEKNRKAIMLGMEIFHKETCTRFVPKTDAHVEHVKFTKSSGCGASVGYRKNRKEAMEVMYSEYCLKIRGAIQHEMFHVLGLFHEQSRPDRDDYVEILWENIESSKFEHFDALMKQTIISIAPHITEYYRNFGKMGYDVVETFDLPYDYNSLMHYPSHAFARPGKNVTIISKVNSFI